MVNLWGIYREIKALLGGHTMRQIRGTIASKWEPCSDIPSAKQSWRQKMGQKVVGEKAGGVSEDEAEVWRNNN